MYVGYLMWHYSYAFREGYYIFLDGIWFLWNFFSFKKFARTFFNPLHHDGMPDKAMRIMQRLFAAGIRAVVLIVGALAIIFWTLFCVAVSVVWPFLPLVTLAGLVASVLGFIQHFA